MNIGFPLVAFIVSGLMFWLMQQTGDAFPGMGTLATRERNPRLYGTYYFAGALAVIATFVWLAISIFQELAK